MLDLDDTIAAIAVSPSGAARGILRISGPTALSVASKRFAPSLERAAQAMIVQGELRTKLHERENCTLPCDAYVWPSTSSYTRQPTVELHTLGSPPLLQAVLRALCESGARLAEPGEFTLRAFLAGRLDLTQAEAVLGVIDAHGEDPLRTALHQLAGGLSQPLATLRTSLVELLADLEAGLDFVEEKIEFISREEIQRRLNEAHAVVEKISAQLRHRSEESAMPRAVLVGPPNSGKSSLFNALVERFGAANARPALVSHVAGTTRDYLSARLMFGGRECEIVDTAGTDDSLALDALEAQAQQVSRAQGSRADLRIHCIPITNALPLAPAAAPGDLTVFTKTDRGICTVHGGISTSAVTGDGLNELVLELARRMNDLSADSKSSAVASTSTRCAASLHSALEALAEAQNLVSSSGNEELIAAELRNALLHLGHVVGVVYTEDILDQIFGRFCIGK